MKVGELIRSTRRKYGVSQRSLAIRAGTDQAAISRIELAISWNRLAADLSETGRRAHDS